MKPVRKLLALLSCISFIFFNQCAEPGWKVEGCAIFPINTGTGETEQQCYHDRPLRAAYPLSDCPGLDRSGLLCYPLCRDGYTGVGPVCWQKCPPGYTDDGAFCRRNVKIISADNSDCPWYDKCGLTFDRGCSTCPEGYKNDGCTCRIDAHIFAKDTYTRGAGSPMGCPEGREQIGALCYGDCPDGYKSDGTYCVAINQTCVDVPVQAPATPLRPFCFKRFNPDSWVEPCMFRQELADTEENARLLALCNCSNCTLELLDDCDNPDKVCL